MYFCYLKTKDNGDNDERCEILSEKISNASRFYGYDTTLTFILCSEFD